MSIQGPILFVHGWSADWSSFDQLHRILEDKKKDGRDLFGPFYFTYYESRADALTFKDLVKCFHQEVKLLLDGNKNTKFNVIVHSTGGLVVREWLRTYYRGKSVEEVPIKRIVMLAPANFGSPLAHKGNSLLGRLATGRRSFFSQDSSNTFQVGKQLLLGLETASSYSWDLAEEDLLCESPFFHADGILVTVFVGDTGYSFPRSYVNEPGSDGTVFTSAAKLNTAKFIFDLPPTSQEKPRFDKQESKAKTAFLILPSLTHASILQNFKLELQVLKTGEPSAEKEESKETYKVTYEDLLFDALQVEPGEPFTKWKERINKSNDENFNHSLQKGKNLYQLFLLKAQTRDSFRDPIEDYHLELFLTVVDKRKEEILEEEQVQNPFTAALEEEHKTKDPSEKTPQQEKPDVNWALYSNELNQLLRGQFHQNSLHKHLRSFLLDHTRLLELLKRVAALEPLGDDQTLVIGLDISIPNVDNWIYFDPKEATFVLHKLDKYDLEVLKDASAPLSYKHSFLMPNVATLVEINVERVNKYVKVNVDKQTLTKERERMQYTREQWSLSLEKR